MLLSYGEYGQEATNVVYSSRLCLEMGSSPFNHNNGDILSRRFDYENRYIVGRLCAAGLCDGQVMFYYADGLRYFTQVILLLYIEI